MSDNTPHFSKSLKIEKAKVEYLPPEILIEIVLRLPIKSIITWTSVSKSWNSLIKNPNFISTHLNNFNHNHLLLLRKLGEPIWDPKAKCLNEVHSLHWDNEAFDEYTRFNFPFHGLSANKTLLHVVGTCNGLVCLANSSKFFVWNNFFVWNPCIRKYVTLPIPNIVWNSRIRKNVTGVFDMMGTCIGFGFDSKTNDYKVVRVMTLVNKESPPKVDVYSLATGKWKMVTAVPPTCAVRKHCPQAFVNGALHWAVLCPTGSGYHNFVLVFDLVDEEFREIMLPKDLRIKDNLFDLSVSVCGESLAAFCRMNSVYCIHLWVMKEYGVLESWTKVTLDSIGPGPGVEFRFIDAVGFRKSGEVLIETEKRKLVSIDYESKEIKDLRINRNVFASIDPYVESLVLLDKSEDAVSY